MKPIDTIKKPHLPALRRFAFAITILNILGHTLLGFEQSWAQPLVALATGYTMELGLELITAGLARRRPRFLGGIRALVDFLLSAHITALACAMLLYSNDRIGPIAFAVAVAIGSKAVLRIPVEGGSRHFLNPSNFGITATLLCFPWVGIAQPYMFTENIHPVGDWLLPCFIVAAGMFLNIRFTRRLPLILTWLACFALQAAVRIVLLGTPTVAPFLPMTGMAFLLFTFYMVTDPATTPSGARGQILFAAGVAAMYGILVANHLVFGLFFALTSVCIVRGLVVYLNARSATGPARAAISGSRAVIDSQGLAASSSGPGGVWRVSEPVETGRER